LTFLIYSVVYCVLWPPFPSGQKNSLIRTADDYKCSRLITRRDFQFRMLAGVQPATHGSRATIYLTCSAMYTTATPINTQQACQLLHYDVLS